MQFEANACHLMQSLAFAPCNSSVKGLMMIPVEAQSYETLEELVGRMARLANMKKQVVFAIFNDREIVARPGDSSQEVYWFYWDQNPRDGDLVMRGFQRPYSRADATRLRRLSKEIAADNPSEALQELLTLANTIAAALESQMRANVST